MSFSRYHDGTCFLQNEQNVVELSKKTLTKRRRNISRTSQNGVKRSKNSNETSVKISLKLSHNGPPALEAAQVSIRKRSTLDISRVHHEIVVKSQRFPPQRLLSKSPRVGISIPHKQLQCQSSPWTRTLSGNGGERRCACEFEFVAGFIPDRTAP